MVFLPRAISVLNFKVLALRQTKIIKEFKLKEFNVFSAISRDHVTFDLYE